VLRTGRFQIPSNAPQLILWCAFAGSWLLVAGPLHQGSIELEQEGSELAEFLASVKNRHQAESINPWWWLLPPVAITLRARESRRYRERVTNAMTPDQLAALKSLREKATSWLVVATGAGLLAVDETWNLHESYEWPVWVFWALLAAMLLVCFTYTSYRSARRHDALG
jgi:hypothetical protein